MKNPPAAPLEPVGAGLYRGPGALPFLGGLACMALIGLTIRNLGQMSLPQTAESYYSQVAGVAALQWAGLAINALMILTVLVWVAMQVRESPLRTVTLALAGIGFLIVWFELWIARSVAADPDRIFVLRHLPYTPVGSGGLIGAQVYATYLILSLPAGGLKPWQTGLLKAAFAVCFWFLQLALWEALSR
ncbi:MAG: hypothetical protein MH204_00960 [Fimbriimonadaceae bacterium]|nr:hypothetical protein [Fimbriimonadaceae bacterium]